MLIVLFARREISARRRPGAPYGIHFPPCVRQQIPALCRIATGRSPCSSAVAGGVNSGETQVARPPSSDPANPSGKDLPEIHLPEAPLAPAMINRDAQGKATMRGVRISRAITLDGRLDDDVYATIPAVTASSSSSRARDNRPPSRPTSGSSSTTPRSTSPGTATTASPTAPSPPNCGAITTTSSRATTSPWSSTRSTTGGTASSSRRTS